MTSKSEFRRLMIQDPERVYEELERLRRIEAAARAWLEAEDRFQAEIYDTQGRLPVWPEVIAAREALRKAIGGE